MAELIIDDLRDGYIDLIEFVENEGELVSPRGMQTKEVRNATIVLTNPIEAIPQGVGRKLNMKIGAVETTQLIAGVSSAMQLNLASNNAFEAYMNDGRLLGAYGPRLYGQLENVIRLISRDPDTRQAAALVWRGDETTLALSGNKDVPCTVALSWNVRDGKLNASTVMRSNDVYLGVAYDFWMFTRLQMTLAWALGLEVGDYRHHAMSLHIYERDWGKVDDLDVSDQAPKYPLGYTGHPEWDEFSFRKGIPFEEEESIERWRWARNEALNVINGEYTSSEGGRWYGQLLKEYATDLVLCIDCRYFYDLNDHSQTRMHRERTCVSKNK